MKSLKNLEQRLKENFDWQEWIPLWGWYYIPKKIWQRKITEKDNRIKFYSTYLYHGIITGCIVKFAGKPIINYMERIVKELF